MMLSQTHKVHQRQQRQPRQDYHQYHQYHLLIFIQANNNYCTHGTCLWPSICFAKPVNFERWCASLNMYQHVDLMVSCSEREATCISKRVRRRCWMTADCCPVAVTNDS